MDVSAPSAEVVPTALDDGLRIDGPGLPERTSRPRRWLPALVVPLLTLGSLGLVWLSLVLYVHLADTMHPTVAGTMTVPDLMMWAHRAVLVMLTGVGRGFDGPAGSGIGLAMVLQLALFLALSAWSSRRWARAVGWHRGWIGALAVVLVAAGAVGAVCVALAHAAIPDLHPLRAFAVPAAITAVPLLSALWPSRGGARTTRLGAGVGLGWRMFGLSLLPGLVFLPAAITYFYGSWSGLGDQWFLYSVHTVPQDLVGAAAFTFGGLHDGFAGETGLVTGDPHWGYQIFPIVQAQLALLVALRLMLRRRRGARVWLELLSAGLVFLGVWAVVIWLIHFTADPRQYAKYSTGWGPDLTSSLLFMAIMVGVPLLLVGCFRETLPGWMPRTAARVAGRSAHPTWAAALTERLDRDDLRGSARLRSVPFAEDDRVGEPLPNGALPLLVAGLSLGCAISLAVVPADHLPDCGPMYRAAFVADLPVPDRQAPADVQRQLDDLEVQLGVAKAHAQEASAAAEKGRGLRSRRDALRAQLDRTSDVIRTSRGRIAGAEAEVGLLFEASRALEESVDEKRRLKARLARTQRALGAEQSAIDAAQAATAKVQSITDEVVRVDEGWRAQHMAAYTRAMDHNSLAAECRREGRSRLVGAAMFGLASLMLLWFGGHVLVTRRRVAARVGSA